MSSKASRTSTECSVMTVPASVATGKLNQSSACDMTRSMSSIVAKWLRSGGKPPMSTLASSICHQRGFGAPG